MKLNKLLKSIVIGTIATTCLTGCFGSDSLDKVNILTTTYGIQYLVSNISPSNKNIATIYPADVNTDTYNLTNKQIKKYATKNDIFIYNGLSNERKTALKLINTNSNLTVIDCTRGMSLIKDVEELWLSPSNYLMLAQNIKNELQEQTTSRVSIEAIEKNYEDLKLTISTYDANLKEIASLANNKTIIAGNDVFEFLEKYGFEVLSVEDNEKANRTDLSNAKEAVANGTVQYVFVLNTDEESANIKNLVDAGAQKFTIKSMKNLSEEDKTNNITYEQIMNELIEDIRTEVYN